MSKAKTFSTGEEIEFRRFNNGPWTRGTYDHPWRGPGWHWIRRPGGSLCLVPSRRIRRTP